MSQLDLTGKKCLVPVPDKFASGSRAAVHPCGRDAVMVGRWPKRRNSDGLIETVPVALCHTCGGQNVAAKWESMVPAHCYTQDEIDMLAASGLYVEQPETNTKRTIDRAMMLVKYKAELIVKRVKAMVRPTPRQDGI